MNNNILELLTNSNKDRVLLIKTITDKKLIVRYKSNKTSLNAIKKYLDDVLHYKCLGHDQYYFSYNNKELVDYTKSLEDLGLNQKLNIIQIKDKLSPKKVKDKIKLNTEKENYLFTIFSVSLIGKTTSIPIYKNMYVYHIMDYIHNNAGTPPDQQKLVYKNHIMEPGNLVSDYNLQQHSKINIILNLRGGMYHESSGKNGSYKQLNDLIFDVEPDL